MLLFQSMMNNSVIYYCFATKDRAYCLPCKLVSIDKYGLAKLDILKHSIVPLGVLEIIPTDKYSPDINVEEVIAENDRAKIIIMEIALTS